jgi:hypothetical protein
MIRAIQIIAFLLAAALSLVIECEGKANLNRDQEWNQWRGPNRDGQVAGPAWPDRLTENHLEQRWRVDLGPSYSGPVVSTEAGWLLYAHDEHAVADKITKLRFAGMHDCVLTDFEFTGWFATSDDQSTH